MRCCSSPHCAIRSANYHATQTISGVATKRPIKGPVAMDINLKTLIGKLNDASRTAATRAAGICVGLGQYEVDIEHLFLALLEQENCDVVRVARQCGVSLTGLESDLRTEIGRFNTGSSRTP